jgi:hypothetical protein
MRPVVRIHSSRPDKKGEKRMGLFGKSDKELLFDMIVDMATASKLLAKAIIALEKRLDNVEKALNIKTKVKVKS